MSLAIKKEPKKTVEEKLTTFDDVNVSNSIKKEQKKTVEQRWTTFDDDDENCHLIFFADCAPVSSGLPQPAASMQATDQLLQVDRSSRIQPSIPQPYTIGEAHVQQYSIVKDASGSHKSEQDPTENK